MRFKKFVLTALACGLLTLFSGCSDKDNSSSESSSKLDTTSGSTVTSVVTVTDDKGVNVTDDKGNNVTSIVTVVSESDESDSTTSVSYVTSVSETIVTSNVTVTDSEGVAVTDAKGENVTSVVTSVSEVVVTVPVTTTAAKTTTTTKKSTTTKSTAATTTAITTVATDDNSNITTTTTAVTTVSTTTTSSAAQTENDVILSFSDIDFPTAGECFGTVSIPTVDIQMDLYMGDTNQILRKGIGMYYGSYLPGYEGRTIMCGHNSTGYLADWVDYAKANDVVGEQIIVNTTYGDYVYEIYETAVLSSSDTRYFTNSYSSSTLILYSCMESNYTDERLYFVAKKISGPVLVQ